MRKIIAACLLMALILALATPALATTELDFASVYDIAEPEAGKNLDYTLSVGSDKYDLLNRNDSYFKNGITWYDCTDEKYVETTHKCIAGHVYMVEVHLVPVGDGSFSLSTTGTVNGVEIGEVAGGDKEIAMLYEFPPCRAPSVPAEVIFTSDSSFSVGGTATVDKAATAASVLGSNPTSDMYNAAMEMNMDFVWRCSNGNDKYGQSVTWGAEDAGKEYFCRVGFYADAGKTQFVDYIDSDVVVIGSSTVFKILTTELPSAVVGQKYSVKLKTNETEPAKFREDRYSQLADFGLTLSADGVISGTPTKSGNCHVNIYAEGQGGEDTANLDITVEAITPEIQTKKLPEATVGEYYQTKLKCTAPDAEFLEYYNPGKANDFGKTGLKLSKNGTLEGTPTKAGTYTFTICAAGEGGEDYATYTLTIKEVTATESTATTTEATEPETTAKPTEPSEGSELTDTTEQPTVGADTVEKDNEQDTSGVPWWAILLIALAVIGAGAVILIVVLKKKKA